MIIDPKDFGSDFKVGFEKTINEQPKKIADDDKQLIINILFQTHITGNYKEDHDQFFNVLEKLSNHKFSSQDDVSTQLETIFEKTYNQSLPVFAKERMRLIDFHFEHLLTQKHITSVQKKLLMAIYNDSFAEKDPKGFFDNKIDELSKKQTIRGPQAYYLKLEFNALSSMAVSEKIIKYLDQLEKEEKITSKERGFLIKAYGDALLREKKFEDSLDEMQKEDQLSPEVAKAQKENYHYFEQELIPPRAGETLTFKQPASVARMENFSVTKWEYTMQELIKNMPYLEKIVSALKPGWWNFSPSSFLPENKAAIYQRHLEILKQVDPSNKSLQRYEFEPLHLRPLLTSLKATNLFQTAAQYVADWIEYHKSTTDPHVNVTKVDFSNKYMGGGWCSERLGFLQEEQLIAAIIILALLLAEVGDPKKKHTEQYQGILTRRGGEGAGEGIGIPQFFRGTAMMAIPLPGLQLKDRNDIHQKKSKLREELGKVDAVPVTYGILAMAASRHEKNAPHNIISLTDLFLTAFTGFYGVVKLDQAEQKQTSIETGLWGAGDFGNSPAVVIAIQYLAARFAGVQFINFFGVDTDMCQKCIAFVDQMLKDNPDASAEKLLGIVEKNQDQLGK